MTRASQGTLPKIESLMAMASRTAFASLLTFLRQTPWRPPVFVKGTRTEGDFSLAQARGVNRPVAAIAETLSDAQTFVERVAPEENRAYVGNCIFDGKSLGDFARARLDISCQPFRFAE